MRARQPPRPPPQPTPYSATQPASSVPRPTDADRLSSAGLSARPARPTRTSIAHKVLCARPSSLIAATRARISGRPVTGSSDRFPDTPACSSSSSPVRHQPSKESDEAADKLASRAFEAGSAIAVSGMSETRRHPSRSLSMTTRGVEVPRRDEFFRRGFRAPSSQARRPSEPRPSKPASGDR